MKHNLTAKITFLLLLILVLFFSLVGVVAIQNERRTLYSLLKNHGESHANAIAAFCIESLLIEDYPVLNTFLQTIGSKDSNILSIQLIQDGVVVSDFKDPSATATNLKIFEADILFAASGVDQIIGKIHLGMSIERTERIVTNRIRELIIVTIILFILIFSILTFALRKTVISRIKVLAEGAHLIGQGQFDKRLPIGPKDELGKLAQVFNDMMETINTYQHGLEEKVRDRTKKLREAQKEIINKAIEAGRAQLSAMVLHNIGNSLTPVSFNLSELSDPKEKMTSYVYLEKCCQELKHNRNRLTEYINDDDRGKKIFDLLTYLPETLEQQTVDEQQVISDLKTGIDTISEIISMHQSYAAVENENRVSIDISQVLVNAMEMEKAVLERSKVTLRQDIVPDSPKLIISKNKLMQVLINVIKNSLESLDEVKDDREKILCVKLSGFEDTVQIRIEDNGIGIAPDNLQNITLFGNSLKGSSGFGLYYCKSFMEANKGTFEITSDGLGKGAVAILSFPIMRKKPE